MRYIFYIDEKLTKLKIN